MSKYINFFHSDPEEDLRQVPPLFNLNNLSSPKSLPLMEISIFVVNTTGPSYCTALLEQGAVLEQFPILVLKLALFRTSPAFRLAFLL